MLEVPTTFVAVEKVTFLQKPRKIQDRECPSDPKVMNRDGAAGYFSLHAMRERAKVVYALTW
jgi:hypothetical protein